MEEPGGRLVSEEMLARMAAALGATEPASIEALGARVDATLSEIAAQREAPPPTPRELRETFDEVYRRATELYDALTSLGSEERRIIDEASRYGPEQRLEREGVFGLGAAIRAAKQIRRCLRVAQEFLPAVRRGPPVDHSRRDLVERLGMIFWKTRGGEMPTRRHDPYQAEDYGPFREFVMLAHEALGLSDAGVDDLIREVWSRPPPAGIAVMGKKRAERA